MSINIQENKERFESLIKNDSILSMLAGTTDLLNFLSESDFYTAPASINYHGNYEGGLCEHCLQVHDNIFKVASIFENSYTSKTLTLVSLLHDVCKINIYQKEKRNRKKKNENGFDILNKKGLPIWEEIEVYAINDLYPLGHGEKSVILLQQYYQLTKDEIFAIRWHMGGYDDITKSYIGNLTINNACNICPLITILHIADLSSIFLQLNSNDEKIPVNREWLFFQSNEDLIKENY
jgi:hypothetical protein